MKTKCERCGYKYRGDTHRCPKCRWLNILEEDRNTNEDAHGTETKARRFRLPKEVMFHLCSGARNLVEVVVLRGFCFTYEDQAGKKHCLWEGRYTQHREVWAYWIYPDPLVIPYSDPAVSVILTFECGKPKVSRLAIEVWAKGYRYDLLVDETISPG